MAKYKKIRQYEHFEVNPFAEKAIEETQIVKKQQIIRPTDRNEIHMIINSQTGEVEGQTAFMRFIEVDEQKFAKVYLSQFSAFFDLSKSAIKVFGYILTVIPPNKDSFFFIMEECLKYTGYSTDKSVFEGLASLIENNIIARSNNHVRYFINPLVVFNGNRVTFAKTYIKKREEENRTIEVFEDKKLLIENFENGKQEKI
jgi:hypothetical protein